ncbi:MAG: hypothetical protein AAF597_03160, partial [Bacteroidota bacterium]
IGLYFSKPKDILEMGPADLADVEWVGMSFVLGGGAELEINVVLHAQTDTFVIEPPEATSEWAMNSLHGY